MKYWWVNQNKTFERALERGFLWSPKKKRNGASNPFYDHMTMVQPGDVVFAFASQRVQAVAVVSGDHQAMERPDTFNTADNAWSNDGWMVPVQYSVVNVPLYVREYMGTLERLLPEKYSPLKANGAANEAYLCPVPKPMADELFALLGIQHEEIDDWAHDVASSILVQRINADETLDVTDRSQLIKARVGQGIFRTNVMRREMACRVTGADDLRFLIASHIKPWATGNNHERLDGDNGLMLSPHIDKLFDRGFVSFCDDGALIYSSQLPESLREAWGLIQSTSLRRFTDAQIYYLEHHRNVLFRK